MEKNTMDEAHEILKRIESMNEEEVKDFLLVDLWERYGRDKYTPYLLLVIVIIKLLKFPRKV